MKTLILSFALVVSVHDGDTLKLDDGRTIRLSGIDAPEIAQPYGIESREFLRKLTRKKMIRVETHGNDRYGRVIGEIFVGRKSINRSMVKRGAAWWFRRYAPTDAYLRSLETSAREHTNGLWKSPNAVAPWDWREANNRRSRRYAGRSNFATE
ncbi:MAG: chromosome partitioning protein ParB [Cyanobacteria bacterium DS2.3.42]|nr:chromosome partitioning protein ParB [Cyanobacteria bacterium DS2.3.42]